MTRNDIREYSSRYDISDDECDRIAAASETEADFVRIWESEDWWTDLQQEQ
jgi:hypothetical protein